MDHQTQTQDRVARLVATVPACPDWRVKDLLAHMTGVDVDAGDWRRTLGDGTPAVRVAVPEFEFQRALTGRRSPAQVRAWAWSDPQAAEQYEPVLSGFGALRSEDLVE